MIREVGMNVVKLIAKVLRWAWIHTDPITKWVQVLALVIAAYWTYTKFLAGEKPNLEPRVDVAMDLKDEMPGPSPDSCFVYFTFDLKNQGLVSFDIDSAHIQAWWSDIRALPAEHGAYIDPLKFEKGIKVVDISGSNLLNMHFAAIPPNDLR